MKKILVPIDFSASSYNAARAAAFVATKFGGSIYLLHVVDAPSDWSSLSVRAQQKFPETESRIVDAEIRLEKFGNDKIFSGLTVITTVTTGAVHQRIVNFSKSKNCDLIVLGAHGAGETDAVFVGSTAQRVIRKAGCPVLSIKKDQRLTSVNRIMFPSDLEEGITSALGKVLELAKFTGAEIDFVLINTPANFKDTATSEKLMSKFLPDRGEVKVNRFIYDDYDREKGILNFIDRRNPQMVSIVTHARKSKPHYLVGVTDVLLLHSKAPVLSMLLKT